MRATLLPTGASGGKKVSKKEEDDAAGASTPESGTSSKMHITSRSAILRRLESSEFKCNVAPGFERVLEDDEEEDDDVGIGMTSIDLFWKERTRIHNQIDGVSVTPDRGHGDL